MPSLDYNEIYSSFLGNVTDYDFVQMSEIEAYTMMKDWLHSAYSSPYTRRLFSSFTMDDEIMEFDFTLANSSGDEATDIDFVRELGSKGMVIAWLEPQLKSKIQMSQFFGGKEQKFYAQSQHISAIRSVVNDTKSELRRMICDHGYIYNSYLSGE